MAEPKKITAGMSYAWTKSLPDYPASGGWTLRYSIVNSTKQETITASANGDDYDVSLPTATTSALPAGSYALIGEVLKAGERTPVYSGDLYVAPDPMKPGDFRTTAQRILDAIEALIEKTASKDQQSIVVDGQTLVRRSLPELITLRDRFRREVRHEERLADAQNNGVPRSGRIQYRFK